MDYFTIGPGEARLRGAPFDRRRNLAGGGESGRRPAGRGV